MYEFCKRTGLKKQIIDTGLSQNSFAHEVNINRTILSDIIRGRINPSEKEMVKIARALDCEIDDIENDFA